MHHCPDTQEKLFDYALNELSAVEQNRLLREVAVCPRCQAEKTSLEKTLTLYQQAAEGLEPRPSEWQSLEAKLLGNFAAKPKSTRSWRNIFAASVRIPLPALAAAVLAVCGLVFFLPRPVKEENSATRIVPAPPVPANIEQPAVIEKIVTKERVVTKKVYVEKKANRRSETAARRGKSAADADFSPLNLAEFKPLKPSAPIVSKGAAPNEK